MTMIGWRDNNYNKTVWLVCLIVLFHVQCAGAFSVHPKTAAAARSTISILHFSKRDEDSSSSSEEYNNVVTQILSAFLPKKQQEEDPLAFIDFQAPKLNKKINLAKLAQLLDAELIESEWFVTGQVNPIYFSDQFRFQDPDVQLDGIEAYARGVQKLFDPKTSRAEIISTLVNPQRGENVITCTWRLSGSVRIGPGINIKPYIVYTDFQIDPTSGLIVFQEDRFDIPSWDILLSAFFPFVVGKITAPPAPPVKPRKVVKPKL